jgi:fructose-bisphosphate aldolase class 1
VRVRIDTAVLTIARLIGGQMAREAFERLQAANDNDPPEWRKC